MGHDGPCAAWWWGSCERVQHDISVMMGHAWHDNVAESVCAAWEMGHNGSCATSSWCDCVWVAWSCRVMMGHVQHNDQTWDWAKVKKEENDGGVRSWRFFQYVITKNSILEHENRIFASQRALWLDQTFTWLFSVKIALKMSFWCSKNKILAKVPNYLTATVSWNTSVKNIYSGIAVKYILVQVQHTFQPITNNQRKVTLCQIWEE